LRIIGRGVFSSNAALFNCQISWDCYNRVTFLLHLHYIPKKHLTFQALCDSIRPAGARPGELYHTYLPLVKTYFQKKLHKFDTPKTLFLCANVNQVIIYFFQFILYNKGTLKEGR
jgi:hypothetical protein